MSNEVCKYCHKDRQWHRDHPEVKHEFTTNGPLQAKSSPVAPPPGDVPSSVPAPRPLPPGDPVLRMALIRAGVLSPQQLTDVEDELRASGAAWS